MKSSFVLKSAAIAACAAIAIGIGAVAISNKGELPVMPEAETAEPAQTEKTEGAAIPQTEPEIAEEAPPILQTKEVEAADNEAPQPEDEQPAEAPEEEPAEEPADEPKDDDVVVVERSYNERIADGEDVDIETYVGIPYTLDSAEHNYTYVLRSVSVSDTLPEGVSKGSLTEGLGIADLIDDDGVYIGAGSGYKWVFVTVDVTNNGDAEIRNIGNLRLCGGKMRRYNINPDETAEPVYRDEYEYWEELCYTDDHYFDYDRAYELAFGLPGNNYSKEYAEALEKEVLERDGSLEGYLREKFYYEMLFESGETKTLTLGFPVSNNFVYGDLLLEFNQGDVEDSIFVPLK